VRTHRSINKSIRAMNENRKWMDAVKARDGQCVRCGSCENLESHHEPPFAELLVRFDIRSRDDARRKADQLWSLDHGFALCAQCHYSEHGRSGATPAVPRIVQPSKCICCGANFVVRPSLQRGRWGQCCSRKCADTMRSSRQSSNGNSNWKGGLAEAKCLSCQASFRVKPAEIKRGGGRFCGRSCLRRFYNANR
jgi:hypothetical protein